MNVVPLFAAHNTQVRSIPLPSLPSFAVFLTLLCIGGSLAEPARAQSSDTFGETLERVGGAYARLYAQPVVDAVGANLNSGFFYKASEDKSGLIPGVNLYFSVKGFASHVPSSDRSLSLNYSAPESIILDDGTRCHSRSDITYDIDDAPTAFGSTDPGTLTASGIFYCNDEDETVVDSSATLDLLPGFFDSDIAPLAVPQAGIGLPFTGTHLSIRFLPTIRYKDYGTVRFTGGGVRQEVGRFLPMLSFDLSVHLFYQSITLEEEVLNARGTEFAHASVLAGGVAASQTFSVFTFYGGLQLERTRANLHYTYDPGADLGPRTIDLDLSGENSFRVLAGVSATLGPVVLNVDFSQGQRSVLSTGFGFQF